VEHDRRCIEGSYSALVLLGTGWVRYYETSHMSDIEGDARSQAQHTDPSNLAYHIFDLTFVRIMLFVVVDSGPYCGLLISIGQPSPRHSD
jgi:hypothetical protein